MDFFAAVKEAKQVVVRALDVDAALQTDLTDEFTSQANVLLDPELEPIAYDPKRPLEKDSQVYVIKRYHLPAEYEEAVRQPDQFDPLVPGKALPPIKSLFATERSRADGERVHFQAFQTTRLLQRNRITVLFRQSTLHRLTGAGLTFDSKLACTYRNDDLYFKSFHLAHSCLNLADYLAEATDQEIEKMLDGPLLYAADSQQVIELSDGWMRRRFAAIGASGVLKRVTAKEAQRKARRFGVNLEIAQVDGQARIPFPESKKEMKNVLRFFNEGYYQGELTGTLFCTDSNTSLDVGAT